MAQSRFGSDAIQFGTLWHSLFVDRPMYFEVGVPDALFAIASAAAADAFYSER